MFKKTMVAIIGCALVGLSVVMVGCSSGNSPAPADSSNDQVTPVDPDPVTPVVPTCDVCFKSIPVDELCAALDNSGYEFTVTILEQTESYVKLNVVIGDAGEMGGVFTGTLVPYDPAKDAEYQVIKSTEYTYNHMTRTYVMEFRYRNIQIGCNNVLIAGNTYEGILSTLQQNAP